MANLPIEEIERMVGSRYALTVLAGKRARDLRDGAPQLVNSESSNPILIALEEIYAGKVVPVNLDLTDTIDEAQTVTDTAALLAPKDILPLPVPLAQDGSPADEEPISVTSDEEPSRLAENALTDEDLEEDLADPDDFEALDGHIPLSGDHAAEE